MTASQRSMMAIDTLVSPCPISPINNRQYPIKPKTIRLSTQTQYQHNTMINPNTVSQYSKQNLPNFACTRGNTAESVETSCRYQMEQGVVVPNYNKHYNKEDADFYIWEFAPTRLQQHGAFYA
mmetsp:Transcript_6934/g.7611  ORF Transcript_6934/g.7611 Transcript_6934/m.7611 type:complete len:123 (-) Transcript_6934:71-439(-)